MIFSELLGVAGSSLRANKARSLLTMLGIIIGVGAVITMVALGEGAKRDVEERIASMGSNLITVRPGPVWFRGVSMGAGSVQSLTVEDAEAILREAPIVVDVAPEVALSAQIEYLQNNAQTTITGTTANYPELQNAPVARGRFFTAAEVAGRRKVCLVGSSVADELFPGVDPVGKEVMIRGVRFEVIGVMEPKGELGMWDRDDQAFIPLYTAQYRLLGTDALRAITAKVQSAALLDRSFVEVEKVLRRRHRLRPGQENDFSIRNYGDIWGTLQETTKTFTYLLASIAGVSLLVGGIGIMNIMLVSVTERTREIGVRMALGARRRDILFQFLIEALALSAVGGLLGILIGILGSALLGDLAGWNVSVSPRGVSLAFSFAGFVGLTFGLYPARRAARMDPIEALRYE